jgi:hypothetical protein
MTDATWEYMDDDLPENKKKTVLVGGRPMLLGSTCSKCGLPTGLPVGGTKSFCQNCVAVGDHHTDGDTSSELDRG